MEVYIKNRLPNLSMYTTTNSDYGTDWQKAFTGSFTQSRPYKELTDTRHVKPSDLPKDRSAAALVHNPEHPCGIMTLSNVPISEKGIFTNVRRDLFSDRQGLWANSMFNTPEATLDRGVGTYSNLQGAWARIGPSTYDATHPNGEWVKRWGVRTLEPAPLRTLYDHRNVDPRDNAVPIEPYPQNMPY